MKRIVAYSFAACLAIAALWIGFRDDVALAFERTNNMAFKCVQQYSGPGAEAHDAYSVEEVERIWNTSLAPEMISVGGVDLPGWATACQYHAERPDLLEGEYIDRSVRYKGRLQLRMEDGSALPADALDSFYASHFVSGTGLIMYPNDSARDRIPRLIAVPTDPLGYISK